MEAWEAPPLFPYYTFKEYLWGNGARSSLATGTQLGTPRQARRNEQAGFRGSVKKINTRAARFIFPFS